MADDMVRTEQVDATRVITINRPEKHNAVTLSMREQLAQAVTDAGSEAGVAAIVLTGAGERSFCVGADLSEVSQRNLVDDWGRNAAAGRQRLALAIESCPKPTIAAMRGYVMGLGLEMALACSLRIAGTDCTFALPELTHGIIPGSGGTQRLPRAVGPAWAMDMVLTGRRVDAQTALQIGLVTRLAEPAKVRDAALEAAALFKDKNPAVVRAAKLALQRAATAGLAQDLELEGVLSTLCLGLR